MKDSRGTQRAKILNVLRAASGEWVPLPQITACAAQYNARVFELRRQGFTIRNRTKDVDGVRHSWFRLESSPSDIRITPAAATPSFPTFGNLAKESYGVD
jgi:hypothetical protein